MNNITLTPAYGRDYKSQKALKADFDAGKDFIVNDFSSPWDGKPCNKTDLIKAGIKQVKARYKALTQVMMIKVA